MVNYVDQFPDTNLVGIGNHLGATDKNMTEWLSPLKNAVNKEKKT